MVDEWQSASDENNAEQPFDDEVVGDADDEVVGHDPSELSNGADDWVGDDLESAYLKAMSALEASDLSMPEHPSETGQSTPEEEPAVDDEGIVRGESSGTTASSTGENPVAEEPLARSAKAAMSALQDATGVPPEPSPPVVPPSPRQILEACLFVGGEALTAHRLTGILRGDFNSEFIDHEIDMLNRMYAAENRPYEIRLGEGGYRMTLREEHERIRYKVYGMAPKEVRLSQEALEVLAVVAYHQPIKQSRVEELGKPGCGPVLRQLVRRELLAVERDPAQPRDVNYKTTPRFLSLFGIGNLDDLPRHEQVSYK